jgi:hypothetical protein
MLNGPPPRFVRLLFGHGQGDVQRLRRDRGLLAHLGERLLVLDDGVLEPADPVDLHRDDVARLDRSRVRRRPGEQHVAGLERDQPRQVGDLVGEREHQVRPGVPVLHRFAVHERPQNQIVRVDVAGVDHHRAERTEPILALDAQHRAAVGVAEVMDAPVVGDRVATDIVECLVKPNAVAAASDHDRDLTLVIEESAAWRPAHHGEMPGDRRGRLHEVGRLARHTSHLVFLRARAIGEVGGEDLARRHRRQPAFDFTDFYFSAVGRDRVAIERALDRPAVVLDPYPFHVINASCSCWATTSTPSTV